MSLLEEGEALGFTSWRPKTVVLGFSWCPRLTKFLVGHDLY
jgi:hypothetical protein